MAKTTIVRLIDDLDGSEASTTVTFSFQGEVFEIDLSEANVERFESLLRPYIDHSRRAKLPSVGTKRKSTSSGLSKEELANVRAWAKEQGLSVSSAGRIAAPILEQYRRAHP